MGIGFYGVVWLVVCFSVVGVRVILGLYVDWYVCRLMNLLIRVVVVVGVLIIVKNGFFIIVSIL